MDPAMRKDIKKSSYYVWFLGAQEAKGLRGSEFVLPVVRSLVEREREVEPFKVTLQVSHKGLKIVQNVPGPAGAAGGPAGAKPGVGAKPALGAKPVKAETVKHLIPHHAVTCVLQQEDIVACILLLYNPVTKCPVHVHAYRCDSVETAQILCGQLQTLIERPENQKKLAEIEARLRGKGLLGAAQGAPPRRSGPGSTSTRESGSSAGSSSERLSGERVTNLYDSLAAELREKLGADQDTGHAPILLPPRDYDTVHRQRGNLGQVDRRRCLNASIVGVNAKNVKNAAAEDTGAGVAAGRAPAKRTASTPARGNNVVGSSGGSSGIGSDHAPSPDNESDPRYLDNASSSDEEWNEEPSEDSLFLVQGLSGLSGWRGPHATPELSLPRARRVHSPAPTSPTAPAPAPALNGPRRRNASPAPPLPDSHGVRGDDDGEVPSRTRARRAPPDERQRAPRSPRSPRTTRSPPRSISPASHPPRRGGRGTKSGSSPASTAASIAGPMSPRERFQDAKEKFLSLERERLEEQERVMQLNLEKRRTNRQAAQAVQSPHSPMVAEPPISPAMVVGPSPRPRSKPSWSRSREDSDDEVPLGPAPARYRPEEDEEDDVDFSGNAPPVGGRQRIIAAVNRRMSRESLEDEAEEFAVPRPRTGPSRHAEFPTGHPSYPRGGGSGTPHSAPHNSGPHSAPHNSGPHNSGTHNSGPHNSAPHNSGPHNGAPVSRSRSVHREDRYRSPAPPGPGYPYPDPLADDGQHARYRIPYNDDLDIPLERYRSSRPAGGPAPPRHPTAFPRDHDDDLGDPRSRAEPHPRVDPRVDHRGEHRRDPRAEARAAYLAEKKRRSVFEVLEDERRRHSNELAQEFKRRSYQELDERERYPGLDRETARDPGPPGAPHPLPHPTGARAQVSARYRHSYAEPPPRHHDLLHRANSAACAVASPRVGIAAVHPY